MKSDPDLDGSELENDQPPVPNHGNFKIERHYHPNGSQKIVWAWAGTATALFIAAGWAYLNANAVNDRDQAATNRQVTEALTGVRERLSGVEARLLAVERAVENQ